MKSLKESLFDTEENLDKFDEHTFNIPDLSDFWISNFDRKEYSVCWQCKDKLEKYKYCRWCPLDSCGIIFSINKRGDTANYYFTAQFAGNRGPKHIPNFNYYLLGWSCDDYPDKPINYLKKVILTLIKHLATNPKAFEEMIDYVRRCSNHNAAKRSYDDGTYMKVRSFMELMKIKG